MAIPFFVHHGYESPSQETLDTLKYINKSVQEAIQEDIESRLAVFREARIDVEGFPCICMLDRLPYLGKIAICHPYFTHSDYARQERCFKKLSEVIDAHPETQFYVFGVHTPSQTNDNNLQRFVFSDRSVFDIVMPIRISYSNLAQVIEEIKRKVDG